MKKFLIHIAGLSAVVFYGLPYVIPGISVSGTKAAIIAAVLFAFINFAVKPILRVITLPLNILSFGLFGFIVNILLFWFVASIIPGFEVVNFMAALWGAIVMTVANWILDKITN